MNRAVMFSAFEGKKKKIELLQARLERCITTDNLYTTARTHLPSSDHYMLETDTIG
jgi:hypothetical protein